ncbi:MAG: hypothetical protein NC332_04115, partial [Firmicutes bacterium]|nr:hypothetical protein [Bacillota bacterium]
MNTVKKIFAKIKSVKNLELYVAIVLAVVVLAVVLFGQSFSTENSSKSSDDNSYIEQMEHKIVSVVEKIEGCGKVTVAISHGAYEEKVYAYETESESQGGKVKETSSLVSVKG